MGKVFAYRAILLGSLCYKMQIVSVWSIMNESATFADKFVEMAMLLMHNAMTAI
jgi:hypothetical protein